jgi:hypothetical protein
MKKSLNTVLPIVIFILFLCSLTTHPIHALAAANSAGYVPLEPLYTGTGAQPTDYSSLPLYLNYIFKLLIAIGALIAVAKITFSGFKYMLSTALPVKADAGQTIRASVWGLVLLLGVVTILTAINPSLTNFNLDSLKVLTTSSSQGNLQPTQNQNSGSTNGTMQLNPSSAGANNGSSSGGSSNQELHIDVSKAPDMTVNSTDPNATEQATTYSDNCSSKGGTFSSTKQQDNVYILHCSF